MKACWASSESQTSKTTQQYVTQIALDDVELVGEHPLVIAEGTTAHLQFLGTLGVTVAAQFTDGLRQVVDFRTDRVALGNDVARQRVEGDCPLELIDHIGLVAPGQGASNRTGVGAQQTDIDHRSERLPVLSA